MSRVKSLPETHRECHGIVLPLTLENFALHSTGRNGYMKRCRECVKVAKRIWQKQHPKLKELPPLKPGERCRECEGLAHRRPATGCPRCRLPFEAEPPVELVFRRSYQAAV